MRGTNPPRAPWDSRAFALSQPEPAKPPGYTPSVVLVFYNVLFGLAIAVAILFALLVFATGKGDAMSGGGSIRTSFKGKASIDDLISRLTLGLGIAFMVLTVVLDIVGNRLPS